METKLARISQLSKENPDMVFTSLGHLLNKEMLKSCHAQMADYPEDHLWSSYRTMIGIADDGITEKKKTLAYFPKNSIYQYREFVEDIGHKYIVQEQHMSC